MSSWDTSKPRSYIPPNYPWHNPNPSSPDQNLSAVSNASVVTSLCLRTLYRTVDYTPQALEKNLVATTSHLDETANYSDFHIFMSRYRKDVDPSYQYSYQIIANATNHQTLEPPEYYGVRDSESNLDVLTVGGLVFRINLTTYAAGGSPPFKPDIFTPTDTNGPYLTWVDYVLRQGTIPYRPSRCPETPSVPGRNHGFFKIPRHTLVL